MLVNKIFEKLKIESASQFVLVNIVFAMTGTLAVYCSGYLLAFLRIEEQLNYLFYWPLRVVLVFFCYQCLLIVVSIPFGQFKYFWFIQKKFLRRFGFKFN